MAVFKVVLVLISIQLKHIASAANQGHVLSFLDALRALFQGPILVQKGYEKVC